MIKSSNINTGSSLHVCVCLKYFANIEVYIKVFRPPVRHQCWPFYSASQGLLPHKSLMWESSVPHLAQCLCTSLWSRFVNPMRWEPLALIFPKKTEPGRCNILDILKSLCSNGTVIVSTTHISSWPNKIKTRWHIVHNSLFNI